MSPRLLKKTLTVPAMALTMLVAAGGAVYAETGETGETAPVADLIAADGQGDMFAPLATEIDDLIALDPENIDLTDELQCLALNIYHEARGETKNGRIAVAQVTLNRMASDRFPDTICAVVKQGGETRRHRCQFSWWCDGQSDRPRDREAWQDSVFSAINAMMFAQQDITGNALFYHADYVNPYWAGKMTRTGRIGRHIFYSEEF